MNTYVSSGDRITISNLSATVAAGVLCRQRGFIGIPVDNALAGSSVSFQLKGVFNMTFDGYGAYQPPQGSFFYWDTTGAALSIGAANDDYPAVKAVTAVSATNGSFQGMLLPQNRPYGQEQS